MDRDRRVAFLILKDIQENGSWSNIAIGQQLSEEKTDSPAFVREIVYGVLRNQILLDYNISLFLQKPKLKTNEKLILRIGFYQLAFMNMAEHAAINETVSLAKALMKGREGFINAVLRNFQREGKELKYPDKKDYVHYLGIRYSADESLVRHFISSYGEEKTEEILKAFNVPAPLAIRVNMLKTNQQALLASLNARGFETRISEKLSSCIFVKGSGLLDTDLYKAGMFSVQGEESQYAVSILSPTEGEVLLDLCAAPGGKSCASAEAMGDRGKIFAFDLYEHRTMLIDRDLKRLGIKSVKTSCRDTSVLMEEYIEKADCVLADVPCSALGTAGKSPEIKLKSFNAESLYSVQAQILKNASMYVKRGGRLLYSTCTLNPMENQNQTKSFILENPGWNIITEEQLFPDKTGKEGFYICLMRRD